MKIYRTLSTVKAKNSEGNKPTHYLKAMVDKDDKEGELVASLWAKKWEDPSTHEVKAWLSGEMKAEYKDHTDSSKNREGFVIVKYAELNKLLKDVEELKKINGLSEKQAPVPLNGIEYPEEEVEEENTPF